MIIFFDLQAEAKREEEWLAAFREFRVRDPDQIPLFGMKKKLGLIKDSRMIVQMFRRYDGDWNQILPKLKSMFRK